MAKVTLHPAFRTLSGTQGGLVYRNVGGQTVIARRPDQPTRKRKPSAAQLAQRERFAAAGRYARSVLADPYQRREYERLAAASHRRIDKLVESDFLTPPVVEEINLAEYTGGSGDVIRVFATDDVEVVSVDVALHTAAGARLEAGRAVKIHGVWVYTTTTAAPSQQRLIISATAKDRPGHEGVSAASYP